MLLDIIVTHYKEPWEVGSKFFSMLDLQRGIDFSQIRVLLINDGTENELPKELLEHRPYEVKQYSIPHAGVSAARNESIRRSEAEWICFCDFDDMFVSVFSLKNVLDLLPAPGYDMLWADFVSEDRMKDGTKKYHLRGENVVFIHAKFYRRQFLLDHDLWFEEGLTFNEDSCFNAVLNTVVDYKRTGKIETKAPIYVWCFTENSATTTPGNRWKALLGLYERNKKVCEAFKKRLPDDRYCAMVARTVTDAYYTLNMTKLPQELEPMMEDFKRFWQEHKADWDKVPLKTLREVKRISREEHVRGNEEEEERWGTTRQEEIDESISVTKWLETIE